MARWREYYSKSNQRRARRDSSSSRGNKGDVSLSMDGLEELLKALNDVEAKARKQVIKKGSRRAMAAMVKRARQLVPKRTGQLRKSIGVKQKVYRNNGVVATVVGPRYGFKKFAWVKDANGNESRTYVNPIKYSHLVEFGTAAHGEHPGTPPRSFLRRAWDELKDELPDAISREIKAAIVKAGLKGIK